MTDAAIEAAPEPETPACAPGVELPRIQRCLQPPSGAKPPGLELEGDEWLRGWLQEASTEVSGWIRRAVGGPPPATAVAEADACAICFTDAAVFAPACMHGLCAACAVKLVRTALGEAQAQVFPQGVRCPMHPSGCDAFITTSDAERLMSERDVRRRAVQAARGDPLPGARGQATPPPWARVLPPKLLVWVERRVKPTIDRVVQALDPGLPPTFLTLEEVGRFNRFVLEAAIPQREKTCATPSVAFEAGSSSMPE